MKGNPSLGGWPGTGDSSAPNGGAAPPSAPSAPVLLRTYIATYTAAGGALTGTFLVCADNFRRARVVALARLALYHLTPVEKLDIHFKTGPLQLAA